MSADNHTRASAFHAGEVHLQEVSGLAEKMAEIGPRVIRRYMPDQHRDFFTHLPYMIVGALDQTQQPWATILSGPPGFVDSPEPSSLRIAALPTGNDPLVGQLIPDAPIGLLGFQAHTRRRNRVNGRIVAANRAGIALHVDESFGNCPKYIQARVAKPTAIGPEGSTLHTSNLDDAMHALVAHADTFFIASAHPDAAGDTNEHAGYGVDVSHRGGKPGFIRIDKLHDGRDRLLVPDFAGNFFFNTFGNIVLNPRVGLLFIDHAGHRLLHLAGKAALILDGPEIDAYAGAERLLAITLEQAILRNNALPLDWSAAEVSPFLEQTGEW